MHNLVKQQHKKCENYRKNIYRNSTHMLTFQFDFK